MGPTSWVFFFPRDDSMECTIASTQCVGGDDDGGGGGVRTKAKRWRRRQRL